LVCQRRKKEEEKIDFFIDPKAKRGTIPVD
jgi:hypothetical protein